ncbi:MAG: addiction module protein [Dehalococcoidia bacterium]
MTFAVEELLRKAEQLSPDEREELAICLLGSLPVDPDHEAKWAAEIERRVRQVESGTVEWIPGSKVRAMLDAVIRDGRLPTNPS